MKLIIAPHADDEVLGCGGLLAKNGSDFFVYYVGGDFVEFDNLSTIIDSY